MRKFKIASIITFLSCLMILFENCSMVGRPQNSGSATDASLALQSEAMKVIQGRCVSCHNSGNPQGGVSFSTYASTMNTVQPGNINASSLYTSTMRPGGDMPRGGTPLSSAEMNAIQTWIMNGAPNN